MLSSSNNHINKECSYKQFDKTGQRSALRDQWAIRDRKKDE